MLLRLSLLFLLMWVVPARADYLAELKQQARQRVLATDPMWLNLLHYKRQPVTGAWRSLADDPAFFNAVLSPVFAGYSSSWLSTRSGCRSSRVNDMRRGEPP